MAGGIKLYKPGVTSLLNKVLLINPPIKTLASGLIKGEFSSTKGVKPPIAVNEVSKIGKNLVSAPSNTASYKMCIRDRCMFFLQQYYLIS